MKKITFTFLIQVCFLWFMMPGLHAQTTVEFRQSDTYNMHATHFHTTWGSGNNYDGEEQLQIINSNWGAAAIGCDISSIPANATILSVVLDLYTSATIFGGQAFSDELRTTDADFDETTATYDSYSGSINETPVLGNISAAPVGGPMNANTLVSTDGNSDFVDYIQAELAGDKFLSFIIKRTGVNDGYTKFWSDDAPDESMRPTLKITYEISTYTLTVNGGTPATGDYEEGDVVNITADAPVQGKQFDAWTGDVANIADVNAANTTITMPASNVAITATYKDCTGPEAPTGLNAIVGNTKVTLHWNTVAGVDGYLIKYGTSQGGPYDLGPIAVNDGATDENKITGLTNETTYYFVITAIQGACESANSNEEQETPSETIDEFVSTHFAISTEGSGKNMGEDLMVNRTNGSPSSTTGFNEYTPILFVLDISAPGAEDNLDACITFSYDDSDLPEDMNEHTLVLFRYNEIDKKWEMIGGTVDTENNTVEYCGVNEFSQWTLGGKVPPPVPVSNTGIIIIIIALGLISFFGIRMRG